MLDRTPEDVRSMAVKGNRGMLRKGQTTASRQIADVRLKGEHNLQSVRLDQDVLDLIEHNIDNPRMEYSKECDKLVYKYLTNVDQCWTHKALVAVLGCTDKQFYNWIAKHESFARAVAYGKGVQEAHFGNILLRGFKYARSVEYILANLHDWTYKKEERHGLIDINKEIAEREAFAASHRARRTVDWENGEVIDAEVVEDTNETQTPHEERIPKQTQKDAPAEITEGSKHTKGII